MAVSVTEIDGKECVVSGTGNAVTEVLLDELVVVGEVTLHTPSAAVVMLAVPNVPVEAGTVLLPRGYGGKLVVDCVPFV